VTDTSQAIERLLALGKQRGYLTYDEVNEALPADVVSSEEIEDALRRLADLDIELVERPPR
jgi:RNA polymerase primary sigma factor